MELSNRHMYEYEGNYEKFIELKADREARQAATEEKRRQFLKRKSNGYAVVLKPVVPNKKARLQRYETLKNMEKTRRPDQMDPMP